MAQNKKNKNSVNNAEMNLKRAREIVASDERGLDFDAALQYLRIYDPKNPIFDEIDKKEHQDEEKKHQDEETPDKDEEAKTAEAVENAMRFIKEDRNERGILGEENQDLNNDEDVEKNLNGIISIYAEEGFKTRLNLIVNRDTNHVGVDNDGNILGEGEDKTPEQKDEEKQIRKAVLNEVLEAAKHEVYMFYGRDEKFASYNEEQKRKILEESVTDVFNFKMAKSVAASAVKEATAEEAKPNTEANSSYQQKALADMRAALEAFYTKKPVNVKPQQILNTTVNTSVAMDEYEQGLRAAKLEKSAKSFNEKKEDYNQKRRGFWGKAFDMAKGVWQGIKQNKARIITDAAVVAGAGLAATVAPYVAAGGLALYFAASSFAWLVNDERRNQKAKAEDKANWSGFKGLNNAWKSIKSDEKKYRKFKTTGGLTAAAGVAGAGLFGWAATGAMATALGLGAAKTAAANTVLARATMGAARSLGSVSSQGTNWALASSDYKKNASEENKVALDSAKKGFFISAGAALLSNAVSAAINADSIADGGADGAAHGGDGSAHGGDGAAHGGDGSAHGGDGSGHGGDDGSAHGGDGSGHDGDGSGHDTTPVDVPTEWNESMGISKAHWDLMQSRFAKSNVSFEEAYTNAYNAKMSNPELFKDIDPVKVVDEYYLKDSWVKEINSYGIYETKEGLLKAIHGNQNATVVEVSDFNNVNPVKGTIYHHQITSFDVDGKPVVHDFYSTDITRLHQHDTMFRLEKIIECGEKIEISAADANAMILAERIRGDRNIVVDTFGPCGEKDTYVSFVKKHPHTDNTPTPETPAPEAAKVDETFANKHKTPDGANVDETTTNAQKKAPAEQNFTWEERRFTGKDNTAVSGSGSTPEKTVAQGRGVLNSGR